MPAYPNSPLPPKPTCPICYKPARPGRYTCSMECADEWLSGTGSKQLQGYGMRPGQDVCHRGRDGRTLRRRRA